ncbi:BnaA10g27830D [Brassica napus]|uniref:BnaA10g27830D protein n=1 Tax=Brassica napus TaxID=3708 RepID=A0A078IGT2_BRANA|nr:BnaA10g27830D [Brassica napus]
MAGGGRKKLRNRPTYGTTLLGGQKDPKSPQMTQKSMPPLHPPDTAPAPVAVPGGIHPDLMVPPDSPYDRFTVEDLIQMPGRKGLPSIDPVHPANTFWEFFKYF